jgi:hypothetical protein
VVGVGAPPWAAVAVAAALEIVCDDEFEFEEELLLEAAEGARMSWKPICWTRTASNAATNSANSRNRPIVRALRSHLGVSPGVSRGTRRAGCGQAAGFCRTFAGA